MIERYFRREFHSMIIESYHYRYHNLHLLQELNSRISFDAIVSQMTFIQTINVC